MKRYFSDKPNYGYENGELLLPMLGRNIEEYPRYRDCWATEDNSAIAVYTRCGGGNRGCGYGEDELFKDENFIRTYDDEIDCSYATYEFRVPKKWQSDFEKIINGDLKNVSQEYVECCKAFFPTLAESGTIDDIFERTQAEESE